MAPAGIQAMGAWAKHLKAVADAIGDALTTERLETAVLSATGNGLFKEYASASDPPRTAVKRTLERLIEEGVERWLLVRVMVDAIADEQLRRLIVKASPEALGPPRADGQVERALQCLAPVKAAVLRPEYLPTLKASCKKLLEVSEGIRVLAAFKDLHECLHGLHLKLSFRSPAVADDQERLGDLQRTCDAARAAAAPLGGGSAVEGAWIAELERIAAELRPAVGGADRAAAQGSLERAQRLCRVHLARLNARIFAAADGLSLDALLQALPPEVALEDSFATLAHAIRDLKATVMARALLHKLWQDAENEISLLEDMLGRPEGGLEHLAESWLVLRAHVILLASLDGQADWAKRATSSAESIETELTREQPWAGVRPSFEEFSRDLRFRFYAVDATLKADCGSLGRLHAPLASLVQEIGNG